MKQAIIVPYVAFQNAPSKPIPKIIELSDDYGEMCAQLNDLFYEHVIAKEDLEDPEDEDSEPVVVDCDGTYGDVVVEWNDEIFMYVTFIK